MAITDMIPTRNNQPAGAGLLREDPARALKDLNQLLVVAFLSVYHLCLILGASLDYLIGKLPEAV